MDNKRKIENERSVIVNLTPQETTTQGFLRVKEWSEPVTFRFLPNPDFRGKLYSVEWNLQDNVKHTITAEAEDFSLFEQVGERPEIRIPSSFFDKLKLPPTALLRIRFQFDTFRAESVWYGFLYLKKTYGDMETGTDAAYKIPKPKTDSQGCCCSCCCSNQKNSI